MTGNAPTFGAANLQFVGLAPETTPGTAAALPTLFVPVDTPTWTHPIAKMTDGGLRGSMAAEYGQQNGSRYDQVTFKTNMYLDSIYFLVRAALGLPDVVSGTVAPFTHKTSLQSANNGQPQTTTVFFYDAAGKCWVMPGAQISDLKFTLKTDALNEVDVTFIGLPATAVNPPSNTPSTTAPMPGWTTTVLLGGTQLNQFSEVDVEIKRASEAIVTLNGTQAPIAIFAGPVSVAITLDAIYQGSTDPTLAGEIANTQPPLVVTTSPAGDAVHSLTLQMSQIAYDSADPSGTNKWMEIKAAGKALANATDVAAGGNLSPILATLVNTTITAI